jgi:hypothetical protein
MMTQITAKYNQCREIVLGYSVIAIGPGVALFAAPRDVAIQDSWNAFRSDLSLGAGGERLGFSQAEIPSWFPKNPGNSVTIGQAVARVQGSERYSSEEQAQLEESFGIRLATTHEVVEALVAEKLVAAAQTVATYEAFKSAAERLDKPMLSPDVLKAVLADQMPVQTPAVSVGSSWSFNLISPSPAVGAFDDDVDSPVAARRSSSSS